MKDQLITEILQGMLPHLDNAQLMKLQHILTGCLANKEIKECAPAAVAENIIGNDKLVVMFISVKKVEGCSSRTLKYYQTTIAKMLGSFGKHLSHITTDDLRKYLSDYQDKHGCSKSNIDNIRRILSSFFAWLEEENYIIKSPVRRIHKIKTAKVVKETYTDETLEQIRDNCTTIRDLAMIDILASTGMRVGELLALNVEDFNFVTNKITINKTKIKRTNDINTPKTPTSIREIEMPNAIMQMVQAYINSLSEVKRPLFQITNSSLSRMLQVYTKLAGIKLIRIHDLRHSHASLLIYGGIPIPAISKRLGHKSPKITLEIYSHMYKESSDQIISTLEKALTKN